MDIAIYDLDQTITRRPTFTHFLLFYAWCERPIRLSGLPLWAFALIGYRLGFYGRKALKQFGIALFIGSRIDPNSLQRLSIKFADKIVPAGVHPGAFRSIELDRQSGRKLVMATAAPRFYAACIADRLRFDAVIATRHLTNTNGSVSAGIDGENCYGAEKLAMVQRWLAAEGVKREDADICFYSDHASDAPMFEWADEPMLVAANPGSRLRALAKAGRWQIVDFS